MSNNFKRSQILGGGGALGAETASEGDVLTINTRWFLPETVSNVSLPDGIHLTPGDFLVIIKALAEEYKPTVTSTGGYPVYFDNVVHNSGSFTITRPVVLYWSGSEWQDEDYSDTDALNANSGGATIFTTSGNYTVPPNAASLSVTLVGGGASGGSGCAGVGGSQDPYRVEDVSVCGGGGGGGGGAIVNIPLVATPNEVIPVVIGSGGASRSGGAGTTSGIIPGSTGHPGGSSSFGSILTVSGGAGGAGGRGYAEWGRSAIAGGGAGGTVTLTPNATYDVLGASGGIGSNAGGGVGGDVGSYTGGSPNGYAGGGGASARGNGGRLAAAEYGGGGGGGREDSSNVGIRCEVQPSYAGYPGIAIITWSS